MVDQRYSIKRIEAPKVVAPPIELIVLEGYNGGDLVMSGSDFGPNTIIGNIKSMAQRYSVVIDGNVREVSFRLPYTGESLARASVDVKAVKSKILDPKWLQLGRTLLLPGKRLVVNPPKNEEGNYVTGGSKLEEYIHSARDFDGLRIGKDGFVYVESFETGDMDVEKASENGLVRALEGARGKAEDFATIGSKDFYKKGVHVWDLDEVSEPVLRVASLVSYRFIGGSRLVVSGSWDDGDDGFAFGVLDESRSGASENR